MSRYLIVLLSMAGIALSLPAFAGTSKLRIYRGSLAAEDSKESHKSLEKGDLLLVSVAPSTEIDFEVTDAEGRRVDGVSIEHVGATKKYVFVVERSSRHSLILRNQSGDEATRYQLGMELVSQNQSPEERLERVLSHWHSSADPGGAVTVARQATPVFAGAFGRADVELGVDATNSTVFDTASLAKHVTGLAVAMLARGGRLSLDDDIRKYVPEVPDFGETITVRHLLHHTSGLRDFPGLMLLGDWHEYDVITLEQVIALVEQQKELNFSPGTEYTYSNTGYSLLAEMIRRVTGQTLAEWAKDNLFSPLGMQDTRFLSDINEVVQKRADGYSLVNPREMIRQPNNLVAMGSSSFLTTAADMGHWLANFDSMEVGGEAIRDLMTVRGRSHDGNDIGYGLGMGHGDHRGLRRLEHGGSSGGFRSHLLRFPDQQFSVCVMSNQGNFDPASFAYLVAKVYLGDTLGEESAAPTRAKKKGPTSTNGIEIDAATLDTYVGSYEIQPGEVVQVSREDDRLFLRPKGHPEAPPIVAKPLSRTRFTGPPNGSIEFVVNEDGKVTKGLIRDGERIIFEAKRLDDPKEQVKLANYAGTYFSPELKATYELDVVDDELIARQPKRNRRLSWVKGDDFGTNDGIHISFIRSGQWITGFRATTGPRVRNVRFVKAAK